MFYNQSTNITVVIGSKQELKCPICGYPHPNKSLIGWSFQNGDLPVTVSQTDDIIAIGEVTDQHIGTYTCRLEDVDIEYEIHLQGM